MVGERHGLTSISLNHTATRKQRRDRANALLQWGVSSFHWVTNLVFVHGRLVTRSFLALRSQSNSGFSKEMRELPRKVCPKKRASSPYNFLLPGGEQDQRVATSHTTAPCNMAGSARKMPAILPASATNNKREKRADAENQAADGSEDQQFKYLVETRRRPTAVPISPNIRTAGRPPVLPRPHPVDGPWTMAHLCHRRRAGLATFTLRLP